MKFKTIDIYIYIYIILWIHGVSIEQYIFKKETKFEDLLGFFMIFLNHVWQFGLKKSKKTRSIFEMCWHAEDRPLDLDAYGFTGLEPHWRSKKLVPQKSWEFPAIFWDVVGGTGVIFRGLNASIHASRPVWLLWCFDHDQFDDPLDVILQKCGRKCYFFPSGSLWLCRLLIDFPKAGWEKVGDITEATGCLLLLLCLVQAKLPKDIFEDGMALTSLIHVLESDIYQAGGFLGAAGFTPGNEQAMNPWLSSTLIIWPFVKNLRKRIQNMQAGQSVKLVFSSPRFVNCDLSMCSIGRDARVVSMKFLWKVGASEIDTSADGEWWIFCLLSVNNMASNFFLGSILSFKCGNW